MDGITLLQESKNAGLRVSRDGQRLVIQGPREADLLVKKLLQQKPTIMFWLELKEARGAAKWFSEMSDIDKQVWASRMLDRMEQLGLYWQVPTGILNWLEQVEGCPKKRASCGSASGVISHALGVVA